MRPRSTFWSRAPDASPRRIRLRRRVPVGDDPDPKWIQRRVTTSKFCLTESLALRSLDTKLSGAACRKHTRIEQQQERIIDSQDKRECSPRSRI